MGSVAFLLQLPSFPANLLNHDFEAAGSSLAKTIKAAASLKVSIADEDLKNVDAKQCLSDMFSDLLFNGKPTNLLSKGTDDTPKFDLFSSLINMNSIISKTKQECVLEAIKQQ